MSTIDPNTFSALERGDIKRYPNEIEGVANRGTAAPAAARSAGYPDIALEIAARPSDSATPAPAKSEKSFSLWEQESFGFRDLLDIINPLQHIPIVATIYRNMTGDNLGMAPRVIGGALWGRIGGFVSGIVNAVVGWFTGKDIGDHIYAALFGKTDEAGDGTAMARAANSPSVLSEKPPLTPQATELVSPEIVLVPEKSLEAAVVAEPPAIPTAKETLTLSSKSNLAPLAAAGRAFIYPYMRTPKRDEPDDDAPRVRVTV
ncbi:MAG: hypothetical protein HYU31_00905 [Deltaproteobacteria bacterium]|nr:hypothetical protein [Deltaproteobacteria bacterium]MBI2179364.1 hypothetical protein [Deltaproteobacteria bacterium]MBI2231426.1 hypothetical protein [Deltaproteobacteria bacterium]MBI2365967.1 hypothetical protein [Deltaproteobacteria bacterium]